MNEKDVEAFQSKLRLSNNFQTANTLKKTSPFDHLYNTNEADAIEIILKSMYGPNVDDYNWIGLSDDKFEIVEKSLERFLNLRGKWLEVEIAKYAKPQNVVREIEHIKLSKPKKLFKLSDLPLLALGVPISIVLLGLFLQSIPLTISIFASLFLSPYSIISAIFVLVFGLLGEGADGFKKGWWERLLGNYYFLTLILAFIGEFVTPVLGFEPYLL